MLLNERLLDPTLINTVGHTAGLLLFGLIVVLLIRDGRAHGMRRMKMPLVAAGLALGWNAGSLVAIAWEQPDSVWIKGVTTASFSILSLLPAVLLQVTLERRRPWIVAGGYLVSLCAIALHTIELFLPNARLHQWALILIAAGFGILTIVALALASRRDEVARETRGEWISLGCLLLFTTSFLHFGYQHVSSPWAAEIAWHHLSIPVVLIVLLQDYRFLLLDTFVRFAVNSLLAAVYLAALLIADQRFGWWGAIRNSAFLSGLALVGLCLSLILFAYFRNALQLWVSRVIFRRQSVEQSVESIALMTARARSEEDVLARGAEEVARHLGTNDFVVLKEMGQKRVLVKPSILFGEDEEGEAGRTRFHAEAQIPLQFSSGDARVLLLGSRRGGRRYLSEDLDDMRRLAAAMVEQVERYRADELRRLVSQAELRAFQAQINPHFLFNALNALYGTIDRQSHVARRLVLNLADVFRYFLQGDRTMIPLKEELRIVQAYLEIESVRLGERMETELLISEAVKETAIPILSIQPLVENAVKHGIAPKEGSGRVSVRAEREEKGVRITVEDTGVGFEKSRGGEHKGMGLGLENVRRRLELCYGAEAELKMRSTAELTIVTFLVPDGEIAAAGALEAALRA